MTAVSVLTRVLPFLLEGYTDPETGEVDPALHRLFWSKQEAPAAAAAAGAGSEGEAGEEKPGPSVSLGSAMVSASMRLLFTRQLTVDVYSSCDAGEAGACVARARLSFVGGWLWGHEGGCGLSLLCDDCWWMVVVVSSSFVCAPSVLVFL